MYKNYVISNEESCNSIVVSLTENEARAIEQFIYWNDIEDVCTIVAVGEGDFDKWGEKSFD